MLSHSLVVKLVAKPDRAEDRGRHIDGEIAAALMANADELLAEPPAIEEVDILASKIEA